MSNLSELLPSGGGQNLVEFVASGTLPNGKSVILNSDGTVSLVAAIAVESIPLGSSAVFNSSANYYTGVAFDPNTANMFLVGYRDQGNAGYGTLVVGTISGSTISFGTPVVFQSSLSTNISISFDPNTAGKFAMSFFDAGAANSGKLTIGSVSGTTITVSSTTVFFAGYAHETNMAFDPNTANKLVIAYRDAGASVGACKVGTISGTSISFGSEARFNVANSTYVRLSFDPSTTGNFAVVYSDVGNSGYGTAILGTISGTSITYGAESVFNSTTIYYTDVAFNPNTANQLVVAYRNTGNSSYGTAKIGTVSGTSITFGSETVFNTGTTNNMYIDFASGLTNAFVISYVDTGNSAYGTAITGAVSGSSLSFNPEAVFKSALISYPEMACDANGMFVVVYNDSSNSTYGTAQLGQMGSTNLTSTNLIGITSEATSSGGTAKINTWGGINEAQTSLVIASDYYAQTDGTITTATAGQKLGTAISSTTINMKDLT